MTQETFVYIFSFIPFIVAGVFLLYWLSKFIMARRWNRHKAETVGRWQAEGIEFERGPAGGRFGGLESMGDKKVTAGIGFAVLTHKDLRVTRVTPFGVWCIPFKQIKGVTLQPTFLGQSSKKVPFIVVRFVQDAQADKLAFKVNDYQAWAKDLAKAARVSVKDQWKK
jgi:hypothetical protein